MNVQPSSANQIYICSQYFITCSLETIAYVPLFRNFIILKSALRIKRFTLPTALTLKFLFVLSRPGVFIIILWSSHQFRIKGNKNLTSLHNGFFLSYVIRFPSPPSFHALYINHIRILLSGFRILSLILSLLNDSSILLCFCSLLCLVRPHILPQHSITCAIIWPICIR